VERKPEGKGGGRGKGRRLAAPEGGPARIGLLDTTPTFPPIERIARYGHRKQRKGGEGGIKDEYKYGFHTRRPTDSFKSGNLLTRETVDRSPR